MNKDKINKTIINLQALAYGGKGLRQLYRFGDSSSECYGNAYSMRLGIRNAQRLMNYSISNLVLKMTDPKAYAIKAIRKQPYF